MVEYLNRKFIFEAYRNASERILFLDYDGTLVPFHDIPGDSIMGTRLRDVITDLTRDPRNLIYIISGRDREFLVRQFSGIRIGLIAEHGFLVKEEEGNWAYTVPVDTRWKKEILRLFRDYTDMFPGTFTEEKESSIAFHYRMASKDTGTKVRPSIGKQFLTVQDQYPELELLDGEYVIEIKPRSFDKGRIAGTILTAHNVDFIMAAGDDLTDERLFAVLGKDAVTIKIGLNPTCARFYLPDQEEFIRFLEDLLLDT